jgi:hypothetical protein
MVVWKEIFMPLRQKIHHIKKIGGRLYYSFVNDTGDLPCARFNEETKMFEPVDNNRGRAYAARRRLAYRKKLEKFKNG